MTVIIGTDPGGLEILRVGGDLRVSNQTLLGNLTLSAATDPLISIAATGAGGRTYRLISRTSDGALVIRDNTSGADRLVITTTGVSISHPVVISSGGLRLADGTKNISIGAQPPVEWIGVNYTGTVGVAGAIEQFGFVCDTTFGSGATGAISAFHGRVKVPNVAVTFPVVRGLAIEDAVKGASATISAQYGIYIAPQTRGADNWAIFTEGTAKAQFGGIVLTPASTAGTASLRLPHGTAPSSPVNGDIWTTTAGLFVRINGTTVGPLT